MAHSIGWIGGVCVAAAALAPTWAAADVPLAFEDVTDIVGLDHWYVAHTPVMGGSWWFTAGGAVADFDNDGWQDMFLLGGGGAGGVPRHDALYLNNQNSTFTDHAASWNIKVAHGGRCAAAADFDGDGWIDLYITSAGLINGNPSSAANRLYRNLEGTGMQNVAAQAGVRSVHPTEPCGYGANWGDYDLDGDLDLFVGCWITPVQGAAASTLFRNNGDGTFTNVTVAAGVYDWRMWGFQGSFVDMDGDGWPELLVAADYGTSKYFRNNGDGTFSDITSSSGTGLDSNGMGQTVGDINGDGLFDWYVTSVYPEWQPGVNPGNMLYINRGNHQFDEVAEEAGVQDGAWGWGALAVDLDHSRRLDIAELNGRPVFVNPRPRLFYNEGDTIFTECAVDAGIDYTSQGRGIARIDIDGDGTQSLLLLTSSGRARLYRNVTPELGNWIAIKLDTSKNPLLAPEGFGAKVTLAAGDITQVRFIDGNPSFGTTSPALAHFGLADSDRIDSIRIDWPRGYVTEITDLSPNHYLTIESPRLTDLTGDGHTDVFDLLVLLASWGEVTGARELRADVNNSGEVDVFDLLMLLADWG